MNEFIARNGIISKGNLVVTGSLTTSGSLTTTGTITATTLVVQTITSSISSITGSTNFGTLSSNTHTFTGSINASGSGTFSGSVGIGLTPYNNTIGPAFDMKNGVGIFGYGDAAYISGNMYFDGAWKVKNAGTGSQITLGGEVTFNTSNPTGSAGTNVTNTERMRITNAGLVGIGTSTPDIAGFGGRILTINGTTGNSGLEIGVSGTSTANFVATSTGATISTRTAIPLVIQTNSTDRLNITSGGVLQMVGSGYYRNALQSSNFGYNGVYRTLIVGSSSTDYTTGGVTLAFNVDVSGNANGGFTGDGAEYFWRNIGSFKTPNSSNNSYNTLMGWSANGLVTMPNQPSFYATSTAGSSAFTAGQVIDFNTARHNIGSHYNTSNGRFTAPVAGRYLFALNVYAYGNYTTQIVLAINGAQYEPQDVSPMLFMGATVSATTGFTVILQLNANDYVEPRVRTGGAAQIYRAHSHFSGHLIA